MKTIYIRMFTRFLYLIEKVLALSCKQFIYSFTPSCTEAGRYSIVKIFSQDLELISNNVYNRDWLCQLR